MGTRSKTNGAPRHFIKQWRKHRGLSQEQLASRLGVATSTISQLETGKQGYSQATLEALADALTCSPADLIMRDPTSKGPIWSIWEQLKPEQQKTAIEMLEFLRRNAA